MSTRATYKFAAGEWSPEVTIYIHWDGYEAGAAMYFYNLLTSPSKGCAATQFIRANEGAELTDSHEVHGDTEYRYNHSGSGPAAQLEAYKINRHKSRGDDRVFDLIYSGPLHEFIEKHHALCIGEEFKPFKLLTFPYGHKVWLNETTAKLELEAEYGSLRTLRIWDANKVNSRASANWQSLAGKLRAIVDAFPALLTEEIAGLLVPAVPA